MKKLLAEKQLQQKKKGSKIIYIIIALFAVLSIIRIFVANRLVDLSQRLHELSLVEESLENKNQELMVTVSRVASLTNIREKAVTMGFVENPKIIFATGGHAVALNLP